MLLVKLMYICWSINSWTCIYMNLDKNKEILRISRELQAAGHVWKGHSTYNWYLSVGWHRILLSVQKIACRFKLTVWPFRIHWWGVFINHALSVLYDFGKAFHELLAVLLVWVQNLYVWKVSSFTSWEYLLIHFTPSNSSKRCSESRVIK